MTLQKLPKNRSGRTAGAWGLLVTLAFCAPLAAEDGPSPSPPVPGTKRALVVCGHPGDAEHAKRYAEVATKIVGALTGRLGFESSAVTILAGVEAEGGDESLKADWPAATRGPATREALTEAAATITRELQPADTLWVIMIGHAHHDGRLTWLNLPGPDLHHNEFGPLWKEAACREQVFFLTTPASGYFSRALARPGRVVLTATEADLEVNETLAPDALAEVLNPTPEAPLADADEDGAITLFDLYVGLSRNIAQRYLAETLLATEHGLLEDNGDGRGTEVQRDYLTEEEGGRRRRGTPPKPQPGRDGAVAATIRLPFEVPPPQPEPSPADAPATPAKSETEAGKDA